MSLKQFNLLTEKGGLRKIFAEPIKILSTECFWFIDEGFYNISHLESGCMICINIDFEIAVKQAESLIFNDKTWPERAIKQVCFYGLAYPVNENKTILK
jgi:hypothetical protein